LGVFFGENVTPLFWRKSKGHDWKRVFWVVVSIFLIFTSIWGEDSQFDEHIFQMDRNHDFCGRNPAPSLR